MVGLCCVLFMKNAKVCKERNKKKLNMVGCDLFEIKNAKRVKGGNKKKLNMVSYDFFEKKCQAC